MVGRTTGWQRPRRRPMRHHFPTIADLDTPTRRAACDADAPPCHAAVMISMRSSVHILTAPFPSLCALPLRAAGSRLGHRNPLRQPPVLGDEDLTICALQRGVRADVLGPRLDTSDEPGAPLAEVLEVVGYCADHAAALNRTCCSRRAVAPPPGWWPPQHHAQRSPARACGGSRRRSRRGPAPGSGTSRARR